MSASPSRTARACGLRDTQYNVFGGRLGDEISNTIYSRAVEAGADSDRIEAEGNLVRAVDHAAVVYHLGRVYLLGGNDNPEVGPEGVTAVQQIDGRCFNGIRDGLEDAVDSGGGCPRQAPPECRNYRELSSDGRGLRDPSGSHCDRNLQANVWYRLAGNGGTRFTEQEQRSQNRCGTTATGYLDGSHPEPGQLGVSPVCYYLVNQRCWEDAQIRIRECGGFFVYNFSRKPDSCNVGICTE